MAGNRGGVVRVVLSLALGAAMSTVIALALAYSAGETLGDLERSQRAGEYRERPWPLRAPAAWPARADVRSRSALGVTCTRAYAQCDQGFVRQIGRAFGLPARCLYMVRHDEGLLDELRKTSSASVRWRRGVWVQLDKSRGGRWLPARPLWSGLALNTLLYALPWWLLLLAPGAAQRWARRRHNRCWACGYDLRGLAAGEGGKDGVMCPECGHTG